MAIVSGYQKMKDYIKQSSGYKLLSRWANANTVECDDAQTVQSKVGGITGISSSLTANSSTQAASTNLTNQLYQNISSIDSDLGGCRFGYTADGLPGYKKEGADTVYPFSSIRSISGIFSAYLPAGNMECHTIINKPDNTNIVKVTIQINRQIAGQTYIRVISNKGDTPTTIAQYSFAVQPPVLNQDIPFDISDNPDNIEIQAQTIPAGIMQQTNVPYTIEFETGA